MFEQNVKHRENDASNDGHRPPLAVHAPRAGREYRISGQAKPSQALEQEVKSLF